MLGTVWFCHSKMGTDARRPVPTEGLLCQSLQMHLGVAPIVYALWYACFC